MSVQRLFRRNRETYNEKIQRLGNVLAETDTIVIGAASGNENSYVCINYRDAAAPKEIAEWAVCIDGDIGEVLKN